MFPMADLEKTANVNSGPAPPQKKKKITVHFTSICIT